MCKRLGQPLVAMSLAKARKPNVGHSRLSLSAHRKTSDGAWLVVRLGANGLPALLVLAACVIAALVCNLAR
jgi:hypothetical protein